MQYTKLCGPETRKGSVHERVRVVCSQCELTFTVRQSVRRHQIPANETVGYHCDQCSYETFREKSLEPCRQDVHEKMEFDCDRCTFEALQ